VDVGNSNLFLRRRLWRNVRGDRAGRAAVSPLRCCAHGHVARSGCVGALTDSADFGFRQASFVSSHAASIQTAIGHVDSACILAAFGVCAIPGLIALELQTSHLFAGVIDQILGVAAGILMFGSPIFGMLLATYTGVLIGATAIPAWFLHHRLLPVHFGTAGLGSAAALLGYRIAPLNAIGFFAAASETAILIWLSIDKHGVADRAIHEHSSGWLIRIGEILNGPLALVLRFLGLVPFAAVSFLLGALVSRFGWIAVGRVSGSDSDAVFASQR
jgi:hypothetical protein